MNYFKASLERNFRFCLHYLIKSRDFFLTVMIKPNEVGARSYGDRRLRLCSRKKVPVESFLDELFFPSQLRANNTVIRLWPAIS